MTPRAPCVVVTAFAEGQPGFLDFSYRIKALASAYALTVISTRPLTQAELRHDGVRYVVIPARDGRLGWLAYLAACGKLIRRERPALAVLLHSLAAPVALLAGATPTLTYWNEHPTHAAPRPAGVAPLRSALRALVRGLMFWGARRSTLVMPIGEAHRDDLLAHGCRLDRVRMLYMGVDAGFTAADRAAGAGRRPVRLLYIGSVQAERGRDVMLEAMARVKRDGVPAHLTIVGASAEQLDYCGARLRRLDIADHVSVHGRVPGAEVPGYCRQADAGLCLWEDLPWYRYNPPTKLFEYLVAGLPVLASNIRTHTEYIGDGVNGYIFDYDADSLARAITRLCAPDADLGAMQERARAAGARYLWPDIEPVFLKHMEEVIR